MSEPRFGRLLTAMVTPFSADGGLDLDRAQELAVRLIDEGTEGLVVCGTTGESPTVFYPQKMELFKAVVAAADGRVPVIANAGDNCTDDSVDFAREVVKLGVDALMTVVPYYNKPPQEGLYRHFSAIANAVDVPIILYNIPGRCVVNMTAETTLRLAHDHDNIVGVKEASGDLTQVADIVDGAPEGFEVLAGDDAMTLPMLGVGATGVISVMGNIWSQEMRRMIDAYVAGDHTTAVASHLGMLPLMKDLFMTSNPIMVKEALSLLGFPVGGVRLPLIDATAEQSEHIKGVMERVGLLA